MSACYSFAGLAAVVEMQRNTYMYVCMYECNHRIISVLLFGCSLARFQAQELRRALLSQPDHVLEGLMKIISDTLGQCAEDASGSLTVPSILNVLNGASASAGEMWRLYLNGRLNRAQSLKMRELAVPLLK